MPTKSPWSRNTTEGIGLVAEGFPLASGRQRRHARQRISLEPISLDEPGQPRRQNSPRGDRRRPRRSGSPGRGLRRGGRGSCRSVGSATPAAGGSISAELAELARGAGALLFVDAIQGWALPLDVQRHGDRFSGRRRTQMAARAGRGRAALRPPRTLDRLRPLGVGWHSVVQASDYSRIELDLKPPAARYEGGTANVGGLSGAWPKAWNCCSALGAEAIGRRILEITDLACARLARPAARSPACAKGIIARASCCSKCRARIRWQWFSVCMARGSWWLLPAEAADQPACVCRRGGHRAADHCYRGAG